MYGHFIQFTIPKIGQALVAVVLYLNFLKLPFVACFAGAHPAVYLLLPLLLLAVMSWIGRDPLGPGMIVNSHLTGLYIAGDIVGLLARAIGGTVLTVWQTIWMGGLLAWVGTAAMMLWSYFKAMRLVTTTYRLQTTKPLPGGKLRVLQISDLHPGKGAVDRKRIPELNRRIRELNPDMILFTGDIFDEHVERPDFDSFNAFFATLDPPGGKWFVLGNHDLFHHWREPSYGRADLEGAFARAHIRILEDVSQLAYVGKNATPVRIVGRKDWLYTQGNRFTPAQLMPNGPDNVYTILLDHEPRELKADAAAGANLILSGHTHGGQIWPTGLVAKLFRYNELNYGMKQITPACAAIVSGGTGTWGYKIRTEGKTELNIGVLVWKYSDTYGSSVRVAMDKYAKEIGAEKGLTINLEMQDGNDDQATQNNQADVMFAAGKDHIIINLCDTSAGQYLVDLAKQYNVPISFYNKEPVDSAIVTGSNSIFVGTKPEEAGIMQGEILADLYAANPEKVDKNGDGKVATLEFEGEINNPEAIARTEYSLSTAIEKGVPCEMMTENQVANWDTAKAQEMMTAQIASLGVENIEVVFCNNDDMAIGVIAALNEVGYNLGDGGDEVIVIGVDCTDTAVEYINAGKLYGTVKQDGDAMGKANILMAINGALGKDWLDGTDYTMADDGYSIRIPYAKITAE